MVNSIYDLLEKDSATKPVAPVVSEPTVGEIPMAQPAPSESTRVELPEPGNITYGHVSPIPESIPEPPPQVQPSSEYRGMVNSIYDLLSPEKPVQQQPAYEPTAVHEFKPDYLPEVKPFTPEEEKEQFKEELASRDPFKSIAGSVYRELGREQVQEGRRQQLKPDEDIGYLDRARRGKQIADNLQIDPSKVQYMGDVPVITPEMKKGLQQTDVEDLYTYLNQQKRGTRRMKGEELEAKGKEHVALGEQVSPVASRGRRLSQQIEEIGELDPGLEASFKMGNVSGAVDALVFDAVISGNDEAINQAMSIKDEFAKVAGKKQKYMDEEGFFTKTLNATAQMLPMLGKGAAVGSLPVIGPTLSTSMWARQGAGELLSEMEEAGIDREISIPIALNAGLAYALIEQAQVGQIMNTGVKNAIKEPIMKKVRSILKVKGKDWAMENMEEIQQSLVQEYAFRNAAEKSDIPIDAAGKRKDYLKLITDTFKETAGPMGLLSLLGVGGAGIKAVSERDADIAPTLEELRETGIPKEQVQPEAKIEPRTEDVAKEPQIAQKKPIEELEKEVMGPADKTLAEFNLTIDDFMELPSDRSDEIYNQLSEAEQENIINYEAEGIDTEKVEVQPQEPPVDIPVKVSSQKQRREAVEEGMSSYENELRDTYGDERPTKREVSKKFGISREEAGTRINAVYGKLIEEKKVERSPEEKREVAQVNTEPSEAQIEAGNYRKAHIKRDGMDISLENPKDTERKGVSPDGKKWSQKMNHDYGYIRGTKGADAFRDKNSSDQVDVFINPGSEEGGAVYIVNQVDPETGNFDEHKVMIGFSTGQEAKDAYLSNYEPGWKGFGSIYKLPMEEFKEWVYTDKTKDEYEPELVTEKQAVHLTEEQKQLGEKWAKKREGITFESEEPGLKDIKPTLRFRDETSKTSFNYDPNLGEEGFDAKIQEVRDRYKPEKEKEVPDGLQGKTETEVREKPSDQARREGETTEQWLDRITDGVKVSRADKMRKQSDKLAKEADKMLERIPAGQPVMSTRDRNLRERAGEKMRKAAELSKRADELDKKEEVSAKPKEKPIQPKLETQPKRGPGRRKKSRRPASIQRSSTNDEDYSQEYWQNQHAHHLNVELYNALRNGWRDRGGTDRPGRQNGWVDDYNILTDQKAPGGSKNPELSQNAKDWLQEVVDNIRENTEYIAELEKIGIKQPEHIDDLRSILEGSFTASQFVEYHNEYESNLREPDPELDIYDEALRVFHEEPFNLTPEQREVLEASWGMSVEDAVAQESGVEVEETPVKEEKTVSRKPRKQPETKKPKEVKPIDWKQQDLFKEEKSVAELEAEEKKKAEKAEVKRRTEETKGGEADLKGLPMFEDQDIEGSQQTIKFEEEQKKITESAKDVTEDKKTSKDMTGKPINIEDFGEKIGGARKDYYAKYSDSIKRAEEYDIAVEPLSKTWPEPNYQKLLEDGKDPWSIAFIRAARDEVPNKPQKGWKLSRWVQDTRILRDFAHGIITGKYNRDVVKNKVEADANLRELVGNRAELYQTFGHEKSLKGVYLKKHHYSIYRGEKNVFKWQIEHSSRRYGKKSIFSNMPFDLGTGNTKEEAIAEFKKKYDSFNKKEKPDKKQQLVIYRRRKKYFIAKKLRRGYLELKEFETGKEASEYLKENRGSLEDMVQKYKEVPHERRLFNKERIGRDHRKGKDVTPEMFTDTFGFRGVEFGNWVNSKERQDNLNRSYDALVDLASILNIPTKAISLNGELGIGFGSRGHGGKRAPAAHYEPGRIVINLTRKNGPGSLAHEWWHAFDHYMARTGKVKKGMITEAGLVRDGETIRPELRTAFQNLMSALEKTDIVKRSEELDKTRSKAYWSEKLEYSARSFENYVIETLKDMDASNDYLANVATSPEYANALADIILEGDVPKRDDIYPYLYESEYKTVLPTFKKLFEIIKTKETEKGVAIFAKRKSSPKKPQPQKEYKSDYERKVTESVYSAVGKDPSPGSIRVKKGTVPQKRAQEIIQKVTGKKVQWIETDPGTLESELGFSVDGFVLPGKEFQDTIFIDVNSQRPFLWTGFHEFAHFLEQNQDFKKQVMEAMKLTDAGLAKKAKQGDSEFMADIVGEMLSNPEFWDNLEKQNETGFKKITSEFVRILSKVIKESRKYIQKFANKPRSRAKYEEYLQEVDPVRNALAKIINEYNKTGELPPRGIQLPFKGIATAIRDEEGVAHRTASIQNEHSRIRRLIDSADDKDLGPTKKDIRNLAILSGLREFNMKKVDLVLRNTRTLGALNRALDVVDRLYQKELKRPSAKQTEVIIKESTAVSQEEIERMKKEGLPLIPNGEATRKKALKSVYNDILSESDRDHVREIKGKNKDYKQDRRNFLAYNLVPMSSRLNKIGYALKNKIRKLGFDTDYRANKDMESVKPFLESWKKMKPVDRRILDRALKNADDNMIQQVVKQYGIDKEYEALRKTLDEIQQRADSSGLDIGYRKNYFPRKVINAPALVEMMRKHPMWGYIEAQIKKEEERLKRPLSTEEKGQLVNNLIMKPEMITNAPGALKERTIGVITNKMDKFYDYSPSALVKYVREMNQSIELKRFLGKGDEAEKIINVDNGINRFVTQALEEGTLKPEQQEELIGLLKSRFNWRPTTGIMKKIKELMYITTMGSGVSSAFTQIQDLTWAFFSAPFESPAALQKAVAGKSRFKKEDIGIERIAEEFRTARGFSKILEQIFKWTGLTRFDSIGKETLINAEMAKNVKLAKQRDPNFVKQMQRIFGPEADQVIDDFANDRDSENVRYVLFNRLLDFQPAALTEVPQAYLDHPNGRIFYTLKTFTIKQIDAFREEAVNGLVNGFKTGDKKKIKEGMVKFAYLSLLFIASGAAADRIKDFIFFRKPKFEDYVWDNILRMFGLSRYLAWEFRRGETLSRILYGIVGPPANLVDDPGRDLNKARQIYFSQTKSEDEKASDLLQLLRNAKTWRNIPFLGKHYYWMFGGGKYSARKQNFEPMAKLLSKRRMTHADERKYYDWYDKLDEKTKSEFDRFMDKWYDEHTAKMK